MEINQCFWEKHKEFILYTVVGVSSVAVNWLLYSMFVAWMPMFFANAMSWGLTIVVTFLMNKIFVFQSMCFEKNVLWKEAITFFTSRGVTGILEVVAQPQLYEWGLNRPLFGVDGLEAKVTVCVILSIVNYISTKLWVFREPDTEEAQSI